ncbi:PDR/VanB family oxidoreductase [Sinomonas sp. ASV322]|uniref:PDR/VanB family oxidoreductase n=1 Tax=Sinomonas sp. ASV322 TaxID=3041920 RepID=UPI0027DCA6B3|nr:PDR/VanB family oxidoreductase [Sinomonas sp. ASV322]MDQ4501581.1 PDR/VanB family oxidoreductase [Sinomonas sp. ASV322]
MAANSSTVWQRGRVVELRDVARDIRRVVIEPESPVRAAPGTHVDIAVVVNGEQDVRSYSVVESDDDGTRLALSVFRTPTSRGGSVFMHGLGEGAEVELTQPLQNFPLRVGAARYIILAGGIGVTAVLGMARVLARLGADYRFVYAGRSREAMAYLDELIDEHGDRIEVHVDAEGTPLDVPSLVGGLGRDTELYMCGPIRLMDAVRRAWQDFGLDLPNLRYETFGNSGWFDPEEFVVRIPRLGLETVVPKDRSMLEALEAAGADPMFDCRKGECGLCEVEVLELTGDIDHRDVFYSQRQQEASAKMCCCVSRVVTPAATGSRERKPVISIELS